MRKNTIEKTFDEKNGYDLESNESSLLDLCPICGFPKLKDLESICENCGFIFRRLFLPNIKIKYSDGKI